MTTSIAAYRKLLYDTVTLPSGAVFQIKRVFAADFLGLGELPIPSAPSEGEEPHELTPQDAERLQRYTHRALARGVVAPKLTDEGEPGQGDDALHVAELLPAD